MKRFALILAMVSTLSFANEEIVVPDSSRDWIQNDYQCYLDMANRIGFERGGPEYTPSWDDIRMSPHDTNSTFYISDGTVEVIGGKRFIKWWTFRQDTQWCGYNKQKMKWSNWAYTEFDHDFVLRGTPENDRLFFTKEEAEKIASYSKPVINGGDWELYPTYSGLDLVSLNRDPIMIRDMHIQVNYGNCKDVRVDGNAFATKGYGESFEILTDCNIKHVLVWLDGEPTGTEWNL